MKSSPKTVAQLSRLLACAALMAAASPGYGVIPGPAQSDPLYAKGYLVVTYYNVVVNDSSAAGPNTTAINTAIADARDNDLALYFPAGTYWVNNTLKAHTWAENKPDNSKHLVLMGTTSSAARPKIKLAAGATGFGNTNSPKTILEFKNFSVDNPTAEQGNTGFHQMLRGIDIDCNANAGAIGLYFTQAQDSSIEDVKITATGAHSGIRGLPSRAWGVVNIEVEGGLYGIDADAPGESNAGSVLTGIVLKNQTVTAIRHSGFVPIAVVGFEIVNSQGSPSAALTIEAAGHNAACLSLIDGKITMSAEPSVAVINNNAGQSFYARNVYVTGANKLVKSGSNGAVTGSGTWKRIVEYGYCDQSAPDGEGKDTFNLLSGTQSKAGAQGGGQTYSTSSAAPPEDLVLRHKWASLPSVDDDDYYDPVGAGDFAPGNVSASTFQSVVDSHPKIFLRAGAYKLNGKVTLHRDTVLFGAARYLTRIEPQTTWSPGTETPLFATDDSVIATTYLGDLSVGRLAGNVAILDWRAGRNSMVHISRPYNYSPQTAAISNYRIQSSGGGRWFFLGQGRSPMSHANSRVVRVSGTTEPMWVYGLNLEAHGSDTYSEFSGASNLRIYCGKSEFDFDPPSPGAKPLATFTNCNNVGYYGHGAIREGITNNRGALQFKGTTTNALASLVVPQNDGGSGTRYTLLENVGFGQKAVTYPDCVALYKRGVIDDSVLTHAHIGYASLPSGWNHQDIGAVGDAGSAYFGSGVYTLLGSGADIWATADEFHFAYQNATGDCDIIARVTWQDNTHANAKAGVMIRETIGTGGKMAHVCLQPGVTGARFHTRSTAAGSAVSSGSTSTAETWIRVKRVGNTFTAWTSPDGNWGTAFATTNITMQSAVKIGLSACSHADGTIMTATFDNVTVTP